MEVDEAGHQVHAGRVDLVVGSAAARFGRSGTPGVPALTIRAIRLFSTMTSIGPTGGAPVPSMTITPRIASVLNGPGAFTGPAIRRRHQLVLLRVEQRGGQADERDGEQGGESSDHAEDDTGDPERCSHSGWFAVPEPTAPPKAPLVPKADFLEVTMTQSTTLTMLAVIVTFVVGNPGIPGRLQALQETPTSTTDSLLKGRTIAVVGKTGKQLKDRLWANPDGARGKEKVVTVLRGWGRYQIVDDPVTADLVAVVTEVQKNLSLLRLANLVSELRIYRGGEPVTDHTPVLWSGDASESFRKMPSTQAAEKFKDYVTKLETANPAKVASAPGLGPATIALANGEVLEGTVLGRVVVRRADAGGNIALRVLEGSTSSPSTRPAFARTGNPWVLAAIQGATHQDLCCQALIFWDEGRRPQEWSGDGAQRRHCTSARRPHRQCQDQTRPQGRIPWRVTGSIKARRTIAVLSSVRLKKTDGADRYHQGCRNSGVQTIEAAVTLRATRQTLLPMHR